MNKNLRVGTGLRVLSRLRAWRAKSEYRPARKLGQQGRPGPPGGLVIINITLGIGGAALDAGNGLETCRQHGNVILKMSCIS